MSKELLENLLIEFDEMGFEPTTLCDSQREVDSFRNRLKQVLDYLKSINNVKPSEALECLEEIIHEFNEPHYELSGEYSYKNELLRRCEDEVNTIKQALIKAQEQEKENNNLKGQVKYLTEVVTEFQKILKVIFEKNVSIFWIKECESLEEYNYNVADYMKLTQEEFDLLKRYCNDR